MLCSNSSTLSFSSLDLFIGQASLTTRSGRVHCRWREWERNMGKTVSGRGDWFSWTRDGRHRVWRSARLEVLTVWDAGDGQVELKGDGQHVTGCDGRHPEAEFFRTCSFLRFLAEFRRFCAWRPLLLCTWNIAIQPSIT